MIDVPTDGKRPTHYADLLRWVDGICNPRENIVAIRMQKTSPAFGQLGQVPSAGVTRR